MLVSGQISDTLWGKFRMKYYTIEANWSLIDKRYQNLPFDFRRERILDKINVDYGILNIGFNKEGYFKFKIIDEELFSLFILNHSNNIDRLQISSENE